ncbi:MAG: DnaJ domain-containing protein [Nitrospiria bacterium]
MARTESLKIFIHRHRELKRHLSKMKASLPESLDHAFDRFYEKQPLTYVQFEEKLFRIDALIAQMDMQLRTVDGMAALRQAAGRVSYIADRLDEIESVVFQRGRRRRRFPFDLSDFFKQAAGNQRQNGFSDSRGELSSLSEAYAVLDLEEGVSLLEVMRTFRRMAKKYHPDARGGDRSDEKALRRVVEAYQLIKASLTED